MLAIVMGTLRKRLVVSVIGGIMITWDGCDVPLRGRKARAMVAYLALSDSGEEQRERLAGLFWSEAGEDHARMTLRQVVHEIRGAFARVGCPALVTGRFLVGLQPGLCVVDINEVVSAVAAREVPDTLVRQTRTAETLLAGFDDLDPAFHAWLIARRQTWHDRLMRGLEDGYRDGTMPRRRRRRLAEAAILLDPTHEEACRMVMQAAAEDGELGSALHAYDTLYRLMGEEYDMEPSAATQALVAEIKQGQFDTTATTTEREPTLAFDTEMRQALVAERRTATTVRPHPLSSKPALFVDKFAMSGVALDQAHLVEGFRIELIACLARFREWYVSGTERELASEHGGVPISSRFAVTTTAYQAGSTINIVMVLHERPSDVAVWGERFELRLDRWIEVQQRIVRRIAATLNIQLSTERLMRLSHMPEASLEAHDVWLRAQIVINGYNVKDWNRMAQTLARGIDREPGFSPLYSSLAQMNNVVHFVQPGLFRTPHHVQRTLALAQRAVALDPRDSRAQLCLGWALAFNRRYSHAELHMEIACELNSNDSHTLISSAAFYGYKGDTERAVRQAIASIELTLVPTLTHWQYLAHILYLHGDHTEAIVAAERAQDGLLTMPALRAAAMCKVGRRGDAMAEVARFYANVRTAWAGEEPATDVIVGRWLLHLYPFSREEVWQRFRDGIAMTGIPVDGLTYHG